MAQYILATLNDGSQVVCEFQQKQGMRRFARNVMSGQMALPVWRVAGEQHPHSGERVLLRTREFINGSSVRSLMEVEPRDGIADHNYEPANFRPAESMKALNGAGRNGMWVAPTTPDDAIEGAVPGVQYPVHRDTDSRRYVILRVAEGEAPERRHYLDRDSAGHSESWRDDADDDIGHDDEDDDDEDDDEVW